MPETLPLPLDYAQSKELRRFLHSAVTGAVGAFIARHVVKDANGVPVSGPDPRSVQREAGFHLTRILADYGIFDGAFSAEAIDPRAYDARFHELESELTRLTRAAPPPHAAPPPKNPRKPSPRARGR